MANRAFENGYKQCPRCFRVLVNNNDNFGPHPRKKRRVDKICKLCRSKISSKS